MSVLYIKEQGSCIQKKSERIAVTKGTRTLLEIPAANVENMAVFGNVQVTTQALHKMLEQGINVNFFSFSGKYLGQAASDSGGGHTGTDPEDFNCPVYLGYWRTDRKKGRNLSGVSYVAGAFQYLSGRV